MLKQTINSPESTSALQFLRKHLFQFLWLIRQIYLYPKINVMILTQTNLFKAVFISAVFIAISITAFSNNTTSGNPETVVAPAVLISWNAAPAAKGIALSWSTNKETNASNYVIERSTDGIEYTDAAMIFTSGNGTTNTKMDYSFTDKSAGSQGTIYYRLRMVGMDGKYVRSDVQVVKTGK
jgi:hypothetical protein